MPFVAILCCVLDTRRKVDGLVGVLSNLITT